MEKSLKKDTSNKKSKLPFFLSTGVLAILVLCYFFIPSVEHFFNEAWYVLTSNDREKITQWVSQFGLLGPIVIIIAMIVQMFLVIIPSIILMIVAILAYGPFWGSLVVFASVFAASSVGYSIGKYLGQGLVEKIIGRKSEQKVANFLEEYGFWAVFVTRLNPFLSNDAISFVGGLLQMGYWKFIRATLVGIAPLTIFIAIFGENIESLKSGLLWGSLVCLILFGFYIWWDKKEQH